MPRKRLRPMLDEVIGDADLLASAEIVNADTPESLAARTPAPTPAPPAPAEQPIAASVPPAPHDQPIASPKPPAFPPAPWEAAPSPPAASGNGHPTPSPAAASVTPSPSGRAATLVLGGRVDPGHAARRRRRSASPLPPLPSPTDIPEDAPGRVAILAMGEALDDAAGRPGGPAPTTARAPASPSNPAGSSVGRPDAGIPRPLPGAGPADTTLAAWLPVFTLGVALVVIFVVGVLVTR